MSNNMPARRALALLDHVIEEIIERNPDEYRALTDFIETKLTEHEHRNDSTT